MLLLSSLIHLMVMPTFFARGATVFDAFSSSLSSLFTEQEEAPYNSISKTSAYEERFYDGLNWVCAKETALKGSSQAQVATFLQLFSYLEGDNSEKEKMDMSTPVMIRYQKAKGKLPTLAACFFIGGSFQSDPPTPTNTNLTIYKNEPMTIYTRKFGGFIDKPSEWLNEATSLLKVLQNDKKEVTRASMFWTAFDSPVKFWNRRNEVWLMKRT